MLYLKCHRHNQLDCDDDMKLPHSSMWKGGGGVNAASWFVWSIVSVPYHN